MAGSWREGESSIMMKPSSIASEVPKEGTGNSDSGGEVARGGYLVELARQSQWQDVNSLVGSKQEVSRGSGVAIPVARCEPLHEASCTRCEKQTQRNK